MINFTNLLNLVYPRVLTQLNRDPHSTTYGSFDRNWWHYKIRDFSSIILQQGGYFLWELGKLEEFESKQSYFQDLSKASVDFWAIRSQKKGSFEEYYPWENGYPPLAFASLAAAKIVDEQDYKSPRIDQAFKTASLKLINRFEKRAANQQIAGLAALSVIKKIYPEYVSDSDFEKVASKTLQLQDKEGWYMEYDGPDLGYLSVSIDCLWDLYDYTKDTRFYDSAEKAFHFIADIVIGFNGNIGMHNSRNTDYIVPYGLSRFVQSQNKQLQAKALKTLDLLYSDLNQADHFFNAVDDRYWSHYIGHSIARSQNILNSINPPLKTSDIEIPEEINYPSSGYKIFTKGKTSVIINGKKGGVFTLKTGTEYFSDFGSILFSKDEQFVNHWWDEQLTVHQSENEITINGFLVGHKDTNSSPVKHMGLRVLSFVLGHHIINFLKNQLIFKNKKSVYPFERKLTVNTNQIIVSDKISNLSGNEVIENAPRTSKRHVASADSYHKEDYLLNNGFNVNQEEKIEKGTYLSIKKIDF